MSKKEEGSLIDVGIGSISLGVAGFCFASSLILPIVLIASGVCSVVYSLINFQNEFEAFFELINLKNKNNIYPKLFEKKEMNFGYTLCFGLPDGLILNDFIKSQEAITNFLKAQKTEVRYDNSKNILIDVYIKKLKKSYKFELVKLKAPTQILIGYSMDGIETIDIGKTNYNLFIGGYTGSGKTVVLRGLLTNTILNWGKTNKLKLNLIDLKGNELILFKDVGMVKSFANNLYQAKEVLSNVLTEVRRRFELFAKHKVSNIEAYNKITRLKELHYEIVVIDEIAIFKSSKVGKECIEIWGEILAISRAAGILNIGSTQRNDKDVLPGVLKANLCGNILGLKTINALNSRIICDENGLEKLRGEGHGILFSGPKKIEIQSMYLSEEETIKLIKPYEIKKQNNNQIKKTNNNVVVNKRNELKKEEKKDNGKVKNIDFLKKLF